MWIGKTYLTPILLYVYQLLGKLFAANMKISKRCLTSVTVLIRQSGSSGGTKLNFQHSGKEERWGVLIKFCVKVLAPRISSNYEGWFFGEQPVISRTYNYTHGN